MKKTMLLVIVMIGLLVGGCAAANWLSIDTDIPLNTTSVTLINGMDHEMVVMSDGSPATYHPELKKADDLEKQACDKEKQAEELKKEAKKLREESKKNSKSKTQDGNKTTQNDGNEKQNQLETQAGEKEKQAEELKKEVKKLREESKKLKKVAESYRFQPGDSITLRYRNTSRYSSASVAIQIIAYDKSGKIIGAASRTYYVTGYHKGSYTWIVKNNDLNSSWGW